MTIKSLLIRRWKEICKKWNVLKEQRKIIVERMTSDEILNEPMDLTAYGQTSVLLLSSRVAVLFTQMEICEDRRLGKMRISIHATSHPSRPPYKKKPLERLKSKTNPLYKQPSFNQIILC